MTKRALFSGAAALGASLALAAPSFAATAAKPKAKTKAKAKPSRLFIPAKAGETIPKHGGTATSLNWSGYAVTPSSDDVTAVTSSFTVPTAGPLFPGFAATWTGIGGYSGSDLIQAGTTEDSEVGNLIAGGGQYYAWYEILPASETEITSGCTGDSSCTVTPGDKITVKIANVATNLWSVSLTDAGKWSWSKDIAYDSSESSAEWILEAPTIGEQSILANVGTAAFGPVSTYVQGAKTYTIAEGDPTTLDLSPSPVALPDGIGDEATPSPLAADGQSFNSCAYSLSCPTP